MNKGEKMKKSTMLCSLFLIMCVLTGCGIMGQASETKAEPIAAATDGKEHKILVVYYSVPEATNPNNMTTEGENSAIVVNGKVLGNNQFVGGVIAKALAADEFRIDTVKKYPITNHRAFINEAEAELKNGVRPALKEEPPKLAQYDTIFLGYPIWWGDMPPAVYTFLEKNDLSNKTIIPFVTHGGSGLAGTVETLTKMEPKSKVVQSALCIHRDDVVAGSEKNIKDWLIKLGYKTK
jgi:flavodoxin